MDGCLVGGVMLPEGPYMIGAGVCKNRKTTKEWLQVAPVVSGSYTPEARAGNSGKLFYPDTLEEVRRLGYGLNSFGMPNMGYAAAVKEFAKIEAKQPLIVSIAGFSVNDYLEGYAAFSNLRNVSAIEFNFGCPNTLHGKIMSFMRGDIGAILTNIRPRGKPIWVKFSPYSNPTEISAMVNEVNDFDYIVKAVVTCNTFPFAYGGKGKIDPSQGRAGLSGPALKHIALGQVHQFREHLHESINVIGAGGIMSGDDVMDFIHAGAKAVQMTSWPFWAGNPSHFMAELADPETSSRFIEYLTDDI